MHYYFQIVNQKNAHLKSRQNVGSLINKASRFVGKQEFCMLRNCGIRLCL
jgi:hypothetical protein